MVKSVSAREMFTAEWELLKVQAAQKVYKSVAKESLGGKKSTGLVETYGAPAAAWLKEQGFSDSSFSPKQRQAESTDVYKARELDVKVKGYSSLPKLDDVRAGVKKGKLTPSAKLMEPAMKDAEAFLASDAYAKADDRNAALEKWLGDRERPLNATRVSMLAEKAQRVFSIVVGNVWFSDFSSIEENSMELELDGLKLSFSVESRDVDVRI